MENFLLFMINNLPNVICTAIIQQGYILPKGLSSLFAMTGKWKLENNMYKLLSNLLLSTNKDSYQNIVFILVNNLVLKIIV